MLHDCTEVLRSLETESSMVVVRGRSVERRRRRGNYCLIHTEIRFCKIKRILGMDGGDGCVTQ